MLLRRIKAHIEKENWFAVGIDFFIVVIGVFIGIQVANWNEARAEDARIAAQLASFRNELILARDDLAAKQAYYEDRIAGVSELRRRLDNQEDFPSADFNRLMASAARGDGLNMSFRGFEEMATTGAISKVTDERPRDLLYSWDTILTTIDNYDKSIDEARNNFITPKVMELTALGNVIGADKRYPNLTEAKRFKFDIDELRADRALDSALAMKHVMTQQQLTTLNEFIATTEELTAALEEEATP